MLALTQISSWKQLEHYKQSNCDESHLQLLDSNKNIRSKKYCATASNIAIDYSQQFIDDEVLHLLFSLADECGLQEKINQLMSGHHVNTSEHKPALHTALRASADEQIIVKGHNIIPDVIHARELMRDISTRLRNGEWYGFSGKPITDIVNIGIGGSFLGPKFCTRALIDFTTDKLKFHFISGIDPHEFQHKLSQLNPETTLFIIASKSFTTKETLCNMDKAIVWLAQPQHINKHIIAVTANVDKARQFGIDNVIPTWTWVGGRYSTCSSINLITCIAIGYKHFSEMLVGAREMDKHFQNTKFSQNLPVLLALLGIWNINFLKIHNLLMLIYFYDLQHFVPYIQQLDMESNGKSIDKDGRIVNYATGPIIWGGPAHQVQHSYFQLLCQGTHRVAADLISIDTLENAMVNKMCNAHQKVLSNGAGSRDCKQLKSFKTPTNHLSLFDWTPKTLGSLMALYEHKIFTQSVIWNINAFDQPGVELSKQIIG
ncbi:glucose-6-phosphate isomerase [Legionella fallonii]|uniref:Glucose-6-phosphate isomerase n=1 Tax=Legionella fallonii LLAP-10 TaxID=1212491 RepID=A0A098G875_9GAMM|nr:glucose-6-phosphate isomerase [Legionella fallonii]CEG58689.1 Glucose-6-phosphate isomerase [Legionella fallonii LLAP-10]